LKELQSGNGRADACQPRAPPKTETLSDHLSKGGQQIKSQSVSTSNLLAIPQNDDT